jgi:hypothetical protein
LVRGHFAEARAEVDGQLIPTSKLECYVLIAINLCLITITQLKFKPLKWDSECELPSQHGSLHKQLVDIRKYARAMDESLPQSSEHAATNVVQ